MNVLITYVGLVAFGLGWCIGVAFTMRAHTERVVLLTGHIELLKSRLAVAEGTAKDHFMNARDILAAWEAERSDRRPVLGARPENDT